MEVGNGGEEIRRATTHNDDRVVREWEDGLPSLTDLTPLSQCLISPQLASAFSIASDIPPFRSSNDVDRASHSMFAILRNTHSLPMEQQPSPHLARNVNSPSDLSPNPRTYHLHTPEAPRCPLPPDDEPAKALASAAAAPSSDGSEGPITRRNADAEPDEGESAAPAAPENSMDEGAARTLKRSRLVWTPELHKRFIEAVAHLGIKNAVPKTIMQLMNVDGLTRENVASHLQKYRLYLKRMQGLSTEGPTSSDHLFASTPVPPSLAASTRFYPGVPAQLEDTMQVPYVNASVPTMHMARGHVDGTANAAASFAGMEPFAFSAFSRLPPPHGFVQGYPKEAHGIRENPSASSSHHILRLFPK